MDTTLARPPVGRLLDGRYRVESLIATGGMATVYLGTDTRLDRTVALKIMHAELANDEDFVRRFVGEARSVARLSHSNVVGVYDQGADGRTLYLAMEYVPGRTLRDLLNERGSLDPREALDIMEGVLGGLGAAHAAGLAHRDVKPENVLLTSEHAVKVADFGLARMLAGTSHTKTGMLIGTAAYLAPEQVSRGVADARTDVYAAGIMLFEMLTGQQPHTADTPLAVAYKHVNEAVPVPSQLVSGIPPALDDLVLRATSRDPDLRPADGGQFMRGLNEVRLSLPPAPPAAPEAGHPDPAYLDPGYPDPGYPDPGYPDPGYPDPGYPDPGYRDPAHRSQGYPAPGYDGPGYPVAGYGVPGAPASYQPDGWPAQPPPSQYVDDLIPGLHAPADPAAANSIPPAAPTGVGAAFPTSGSSGAGSSTSAFSATGFAMPPGNGNPGLTRRAPDDAFHQATNHTLVVAPGAATDYGRGRGGSGHGGPSEPGLQRWLFSRRLYYVLGGLVAVLLIGLLIWWQSAGKYTTVPSVGGLSASTARLEVRNQGLTAKMGKPQFSARVAKGNVIAADPATGSRVSKGGTVLLIVSAGPHMIPVPQVTGSTLATAQAALRHAGLIPGKVTDETSTTIQSGIVISTTPASGVSWPQNRPVLLVVSTGQPVPDFVGQQKAVAEQWAQANSVSLNEVADAKSEQPAGTIIQQSVQPGSSFTAHEVITIDISNGPQMVNVPNVDGQQVSQATQALSQAGFQVKVDQVGPLNTVFNYSPSGQAPQGSTITIYVGLPHL
jgi:beta-lactam-binding protein with PASTA domain/predicted Ser/Thr protein kinase